MGVEIVKSAFSLLIFILYALLRHIHCLIKHCTAKTYWGVDI